MPVCDVCSRSLSFADGYALTTREVVLTAAYWIRAFRGGLAYVHDSDPRGGELLTHYIEEQAAQYTGWLVCESCSDTLEFDRTAARRYAKKQENPPGSGPVPSREVAPYAFEAWRQLYGGSPDITKFADVLVSVDKDSGDVRVIARDDQVAPSPGRKWWQFWRSR